MVLTCLDVYEAGSTRYYLNGDAYYTFYDGDLNLQPASTQLKRLTDTGYMLYTGGDGKRYYEKNGDYYVYDSDERRFEEDPLGDIVPLYEIPSPAAEFDEYTCYVDENDTLFLEKEGVFYVLDGEGNPEAYADGLQPLPLIPQDYMVFVDAQNSCYFRRPGESRFQVLVKLYFKADMEAVAAKMQALADAAPEGVRAELEVNPNNLF